jgi:tartrate dehydratase beta subunit/fumarate hydratase class I family protein
MIMSRENEQPADKYLDLGMETVVILEGPTLPKTIATIKSGNEFILLHAQVANRVTQFYGSV